MHTNLYLNVLKQKTLIILMMLIVGSVDVDVDVVVYLSRP